MKESAKGGHYYIDILEDIKLNIWYWTKNNLKELLGTLLSICSVLASIYFKDLIKEQPVYLLIPLSIPIILLVLLVYFKTREKEFYHIELKNRKDKDDWIGEGTFEYDRINNCYIITNAAYGCIFSKCFDWSDYLMSFDFRIIDDCIGAVFRAQNLSNYLMLQIGVDKINPHIKVNGAWKVVDSIDLTFSKPLSRDSWYKCEINCEKRRIIIKILDRKTTLIEREWAPPSPDTYILVSFPSIASPFPYAVTCDTGTIGFRNCGKERALVRNLLVQKK
jgi:hypothetical protein